MQTVPMKSYLKKRFREIWPKRYRILAVHLDGFSHRVIFDSGRNSQIMAASYSHCTPEGNWTLAAAQFFKDIPNAGYQNNAKEIVFITPENR